MMLSTYTREEKSWMLYDGQFRIRHDYRSGDPAHLL